MSLSKYYVEDYFDEQLFTAGIVVKDNEAIFSEDDFIPLRLRKHKGPPLNVKIHRLLDVCIIATKCKKESIVFFHFPLHAAIYNLLHSLLKWRGIKTVAMIIDIDGLRDNDKKLLQKEINQLSKFNSLIVHNDAMKEVLQQHLPSSNIFTINIFDYPAKKNTNTRIFSRTICIAANFAKATFVNGLNELKEFHFNLYGKGYDDKSKDSVSNVSYKGVFLPGELPLQIEGSFGLVWDGSSIENCDKYLRYNTPHKISLYLVAGIPVIVWKESAMADFVEKNNLGITINSLPDLDEKFNQVSASDYSLMLQNVQSIGEKLRKGYYLRDVVSKVINETGQ